MYGTFGVWKLPAVCSRRVAIKSRSSFLLFWFYFISEPGALALRSTKEFSLINETVPFFFFGQMQLRYSYFCYNVIAYFSYACFVGGMLLKTLVSLDVMPCRSVISDFLTNLSVLIPGSRYCFAWTKRHHDLSKRRCQCTHFFIIQGESFARVPKLLSMYTVEQCGFLVRKYWQTGSFKACQTAFRTEFGERRALSKCCIQKLVKKLETRGKPI